MPSQGESDRSPTKNPQRSRQGLNQGASTIPLFLGTVAASGTIPAKFWKHRGILN
ncbi:hypothetical protein [Allocoleopsis sp.]|uniref:hypothetical protein n=1 Tax=Allocoleopsis sp. TaxID=3088169 RepID=UPI002FD31A77